MKTKFFQISNQNEKRKLLDKNEAVPVKDKIMPYFLLKTCEGVTKNKTTG